MAIEAKTIPVYNTDGKEVETFKLDPAVFDGTINSRVMYQAVNAFRANQRRGLASTKTRGEVSGGGRKPWRQKGTGRARVGSTRSPLWRHGGVVFGPHPRDFSVSVPAAIRKAALRSGLNAKVKENGLIVLDTLAGVGSKTKEAAKIFKNLKVKTTSSGTMLLLWEKTNDSARRGLRNIGFLDIGIAQDTNIYEIMAHQKIVITKDALQQLTARLKT